ncbi:MAG: AbrB/MazE/SpoVT family DNA-binding domain-containing protein [Nanoarchaeota archaeon]|nr:AbrB/MazE/SpoVT family DNA-binding domain-containing protein [Nanoarchaeota archaeon]
MYSKIVQTDARGQIVIPKMIRQELELGEAAPFWIYVKDGKIVLEKIKKPK